MRTKYGVVLVALAMIWAGAEASYPETREYLLGDTDGIHYDGAGGVDDVYVEPNVLTYLQSVAPGEDNDHFDVLGSNNNVPFTFLFPLADGEVVIAATLELGLRATNSGVSTDEFAVIRSDASEQWKYWFSDLGWLPLPETGVTARSVDLGNVLGVDHLALLQDGQFDAYVTDDSAVDYASLSIEVVPEPATLALLALGGLALLRRRRGYDG